MVMVYGKGNGLWKGLWFMERVMVYGKCYGLWKGLWFMKRGNNAGALEFCERGLDVNFVSSVRERRLFTEWGLREPMWQLRYIAV